MIRLTTVFSSTLVLSLTALGQDTFHSTMTGEQALPSHVTALNGGADFTLTPNNFIIGQAWVEFGLESDTVQVFRSTSSNDLGVPLFTLTPLSGYYPTGDAGEPGSIGWIFDINRQISVADFADLQAGNWWINVSTPAFPEGEIRGQITAVPEPSTSVLAGVGALALGIRFLMRRLKRIV